ncbi:hypothetical protein EPYR_01069 [Erwinia pyrifoliae DSM 12163]|nr:hypothetical protein EPYR_01069 [Erwinia pyrifoliae DSM 12163]
MITFFLADWDIFSFKKTSYICDVRYLAAQRVYVLKNGVI